MFNKSLNKPEVNLVCINLVSNRVHKVVVKINSKLYRITSNRARSNRSKWNLLKFMFTLISEQLYDFIWESILEYFFFFWEKKRLFKSFYWKVSALKTKVICNKCTKKSWYERDSVKVYLSKHCVLVTKKLKLNVAHIMYHIFTRNRCAF